MLTSISLSLARFISKSRALATPDAASSSQGGSPTLASVSAVRRRTLEAARQAKSPAPPTPMDTELGSLSASHTAHARAAIALREAMLAVVAAHEEVASASGALGKAVGFALEGLASPARDDAFHAAVSLGSLAPATLAGAVAQAVEPLNTWLADFQALEAALHTRSLSALDMHARNRKCERLAKGAKTAADASRLQAKVAKRDATRMRWEDATRGCLRASRALLAAYTSVLPSVVCVPRWAGASYLRSRWARSYTPHTAPLRRQPA